MILFLPPRIFFQKDTDTGTESVGKADRKVWEKRTAGGDRPKRHRREGRNSRTYTVKSTESWTQVINPKMLER